MKAWKLVCAMVLIAGLLFGCASKKETVQEPKVNPQLQENGMGEGFLTATSLETQTPCNVRVFREMRDDGSGENLLIEVKTGTKVLRKLLYEGACGIGELLYLADLTGDGVQEIILHHNTGGCGGFGSYISWVMKVTEEDICIIFEEDRSVDTGFIGSAVDGYQLKVQHSLTNYELKFDAKQEHELYFDGTGKADSDTKMEFDCIYEFEPLDEDGDGVFELHCKQYASLRDHADYVGSACSVWKWDEEAQKFTIAEAWFEPYTEGQ